MKRWSELCAPSMTESPIAVTCALGMGVSVVVGAECAGAGAAAAADVGVEARGPPVVVVIAMFAGFAGKPGGRGAGCATARPMPSSAVVTTTAPAANPSRVRRRRRCSTEESRSACCRAAKRRPSAPLRIGTSTNRYEAAASPTVIPHRNTKSGMPVKGMSSPGRVTRNTGQCHR